MTASADHPAIKPEQTGRTYWQSFEHLAESPEVAESLEKEFADYTPDDITAAPTRRKFLKYAAAGMSLAGIGLSGCRRWPTEVIAPYAHAVNDHIPGVPEYYASSWEVDGVGAGLIVESFDGRPIKVEGNALHPSNLSRNRNSGACDTTAVAQTLSLYDPERARGYVDRRGQAPVTLPADAFEGTILPQLREALAAGRLAVLTQPTASPTYTRLLAELPEGAHYTWAPLATDYVVKATELAFGRPLRAVYELDEAMIVVGFDDDYIGQHPAHVKHEAAWARLRVSADDEAKPRMSRTYHVDCQHSLTGANADVRLPLKPSRLRRILEALAYEVGVTGVALPETLTDRESDFVKKAAKDLKANTGNSLVAVGAHLPPGLQVLGFRINEQLGSLGRALTFVEDPTVTGGSIHELASRIDAGEIDAIVTLGGNPAYDAPADLDFAGKLASVPLSVHLSDYVDETARVSDIHVARAHFLEAWGDTRGWEGTVAPQQPLILPLFGGVSEIELLARIQDRPLTEGLALVLETFAGLMDRDLRPATDPDFRKFLHDGILADSTFAKVDVASPTAVSLEDVIAEADGLEVVFCGSPSLHDGRHANNGWLQELPDAMTKLTWDNAVLVNVKDAEKLGIRTNDLVTLTLADRSMVIAVYVMPGQPEGVIALPLGYGRRAGGSLAVTTASEGGDGGGGFDTYQLRTTGGLDIASGCQLTPTGERYTLAMTQNHHLIDDTGYKGRIMRVGEHGKPGKIIRETTFDKHEKHVKAGNKG
ncbi:MAG: TAT-variant-translocated molybdopterin oxidoreductase, partial [Planctomycetota bacterium]